MKADHTPLRHAILWVALLVFACLAARLWFATPARAGGVVGNGTPASCTSSALDTALANGDDVTFSCGSAPYTIVLTQSLTILYPSSIQGSGLITLSGDNSRPLIQIYPGTSLTLTGLTLAQGYGTFGAIYNSSGSTLVISGSQIIENAATNNGGAIDNEQGVVTITNSTIAINTATYNGGGIYSSGGMLAIAGSQVISNSASSNGGALYLSGNAWVQTSHFEGNMVTGRGGGIFTLNTAQLTIGDSQIVSNTASSGGGICNNGNMNIGSSTLSYNTTPGGVYGGGLLNNGPVNISGTLIYGNVADNPGGGIYNLSSGALHIEQSTVAANVGTQGGAIYNESSAASLVNVTLSGNVAISISTLDGQGGGVYNTGSLYLTDTDVIRNSAEISGGGIWNDSLGAVTLVNTIVAYSPAGNNCVGVITSGGFNISSDATCALDAMHDLTDTDPLLSPLGDHRGLTPTHLPWPGSPAIDFGTCLLDVPTDQRGVTRPQGNHCDVGSVEVSRLDVPGVFVPLVVR